ELGTSGGLVEGSTVGVAVAGGVWLMGGSGARCGAPAPGDLDVVAMSRTSLVPALVPSLAHSSTPWTPSSAAKNTVRRTAASSLPKPKRDEFGPGRMSRTITVLAAVPRVRHSSVPWRPSDAVKKRTPPALVRDSGNDDPRPGSMSRTITVVP